VTDSQGLHADLKRLAWCASQVRNRLSARYWRGVVGLQRQMQEISVSVGSSREACERVLLSLAALTGFSEEDMMHDEGWRVMRIARRIERLQFVANILVRQLESPNATRPETAEWLLEVCDSTPIYRARYAGVPRLAQMLNLLLYDAGHPMALAFHRRSIDRDLDDLARTLGGERERGVIDMPLMPAGSAEQLDAAGPAGQEARSALAAELRGPQRQRQRAFRPHVAPLFRAHRCRRARTRHMSRKYRIRHETRYRYGADVMHSHHLLHLVPRPPPTSNAWNTRSASTRRRSAAPTSWTPSATPCCVSRWRSRIASSPSPRRCRSRCTARPAILAEPATRGRRCAIRSPIAVHGRRAISSMPRASATSRRTCA
jgi:hypothetical protein